MPPPSRALFPLWGSGSIRQLPPHRNPGLELVYVSRGHLRWQIEGHVHEVGPGSLFYTLPWELHGSVDEFEPGHRWDFVVLGLEGGHALRTARLPQAFGLSGAEGGRLLARLARSTVRAFPAEKRLSWLLPELARELSSDGGTRIALALSQAILLELDAMVARSKPRAGSPAPPRKSARFDLLLQRLEKNYADSWTLREMCRVAGTRRTYLNRLFKEKTGDSPVTYLNRLRVGKAQEALRNPASFVTNVALTSGFQSSQYFARVFRQFTSYSPTAYRRKWHL